MSDYDLTKLDRPLGEYPDAVIGALVRAAWGNPDRVDVRITDGEWECNSGSRLYPDRIYRLALYDEVKRLRAALTIYAQSGSWRLGGCCDPNSPNFTGEAIARAALKGDDNA